MSRKSGPSWAARAWRLHRRNWPKHCRATSPLIIDFLLAQHLQMLEHLEETVREFEAQIEAALTPFRGAAERLITIPGVSTTAAHVIIAEIGIDMSAFPSAAHLRSWAGLSPQLNESAQ